MIKTASRMSCLLLLACGLTACQDRGSENEIDPGAAPTATEELGPPLISVGSAAGDDWIGDVWLVALSRTTLYVYEIQAPSIRAFSLETGEYLGAVGRQGDGPGDYRTPRSMAASAAGELYVFDGRSVNVYGPEREPVTKWRVDQRASLLMPAPIVSVENSILVPTLMSNRRTNPADALWEVVEYTRDGTRVGARKVPRMTGASAYVEWTIGGSTFLQLPPFGRVAPWHVNQSGEIIAASPTSGEITIVDRNNDVQSFFVDPVEAPIDPEESAWHQERFDAQLARATRFEGWESNAGIATTRPSVVAIFDDHRGNVWLKRPVAGRYVASCECRRESFVFAVYDRTGQEFGTFRVPDGKRGQAAPAIFERLIAINAVNDEEHFDVIHVYRIDDF